jgi:choice-of-anchor B domain-containing protein
MRSIFTVLFLFISIDIFSQKDPDLNMKIIAHVPDANGGSGVWHFVKDSIEYAGYGSNTALVIYSLEDPTKPIERYRAEGVKTIWREVFAYGDYIYGVTDQSADGVIIINMKEAPAKISHKFWTTNVSVNNISGKINTCHTVFVDEKGVLCLNGCNPWEGVLFFDITADPENPKFLGGETKRYCHDMYMRGDTMWSSDILDGLLSIWNVKDKSNPIEMATITTPNAFTHNAWISNDAKYVFTTDEKEEAFVASYDVSDLSNIKLLDKYRPRDTEGKRVIPHNTRYLDGYLITAYYTDGVKIIDANKPDNLIEVGTVDTYFGPDGGFNGCWGVSPYLPSKTILASDIQGGLFIIKPEYVRACYLEGDVRDSLDGSAINGAKIVLQVPKVNYEESNSKGEYKTGYATAGTYKANFTHPKYYPATIDVTLANGEVTIKNVKLIPKANQLFTITVIDSVSNTKIQQAKVLIQNRSDKENFEGNTDGIVSSKVFSDSIVTIFVGKWGYKEKAIEIDTRNPISNFTVALVKGYKDDFILNQGWTESSTATLGKWIRTEPIGTYQRNVSVQTENDLPNDLGDECYVTGNGDVAAGTNDLDNGSTTIISPEMDLSSYNDPILVYSRWFVNSGGTGTPNDKVIFSLHDGVSTNIIETVSNSLNAWVVSPQFHIKNFVSKLNKVQFSITASDDDPGHLVEAALDGFLVYDGNPIVSNKDLNENTAKFTVSQNPFKEKILIQFSNNENQNLQFQIVDYNGKILMENTNIAPQSIMSVGESLRAGTYQFILKDKNKILQSQTILKI